jgi:hypothetical protein
LVVSSEVLQRLVPEERKRYVSRLHDPSPRLALFSPNAGNESHVNLSGLDAIQLDELNALINQDTQSETIIGFIDMPPFPPGITRSETQREEASSGKVEAFAMWGLGIYAHFEKFLPQSARRRWAHIVFGLHSPQQR